MTPTNHAQCSICTKPARYQVLVNGSYVRVCEDCLKAADAMR